MSDFGHRLKLIRRQQNITQKELATALNLAQSTIANYENNIRFPGELHLRQLSDTLNVSIDYLLDIQSSLNPDETSAITDENILSDTQLEALHLKLIDLLLSGDETASTDMVMAAFQQGNKTLKLIECVYVPILKTTGLMWQKGEISIANEHFISNLIDRWLAMTSTATQSPKKPYSAVFIVPSGEEHVLILKMIKEYFRQCNWKTYYLGNSIPFSSLNPFIELNQIDLVVMSVLIQSHLNSTEDLIQALKSQNVRHSPKILIGGSAIDDAAHAIKGLKADYYAENITELSELIDVIEKEIKK
ncbi:MAG TPA: helix-turn-helix domain-containing protein [Fusibacter sp.]|nr:helix-turn-helix domain-containing protein [Fusibacter sp.]